MEKPRVDRVAGLSPAIAIEQKSASKSPRSTVGTVTEVHDYLRVLFARLGQPYCPNCKIPVGTQSRDEIVDRVLALPEGSKLYLLAPLEKKGQDRYETLIDEARRAGYVRVRLDGKSQGIDEVPPIDHRRKHKVEVVVDRIIVRASQRSRIAESVEKSLDLGRGVMHIAHVEDGRPEPGWRVQRFSQHFACEKCGRGFEPLSPAQFSFNSPLGWCQACEGLGVQQGASPALLIRDPRISLRRGALAAWPDLQQGGSFLRFAEAMARHVGFSLDTPLQELEPAHQRALMHGTGDAWISLVEDALEANTEEFSDIRTPDVSDDAVGLGFQYKGLFPAIDASKCAMSSTAM